MKKIADKKMKLFADNESVITDYKICNPILQPNTIEVYFDKAKVVAGYGRSMEEVGDNLYTALENIGYSSLHEVGGYVKVSSIDELKTECAKYNAIILTPDDLIQRLQDNGYITEKATDLSKDGWLDQLEQALNPQLFSWPFDYNPVYDFNDIPDDVANSIEAAYIYACSGNFNNIVINSGVLSQKDTVVDIIQNINCDSKIFENIWNHIPPAIQTDIDVINAVLQYQNEYAFKIVDITKNTSLLTKPAIIRTLAKQGVIRNYPQILANPSMELAILQGLVEHTASVSGLSSDDIDNMTMDELIDALKPFLGTWWIPNECIPDRLFDSDDILILSGAIGKIPYAKKNNMHLITKICEKHPVLLNDRKHLLNNNHDLMLAYLTPNNGVYDDDIKSCANIINNNGYMAYDDIKEALLARGLYSLKNETGYDNKNTALIAVKKNANEYIYLSDRLKTDEDILQTVMVGQSLGEWFIYVPAKATPIVEKYIDQIKGISYDVMSFNPMICNYSVSWATIPVHLMTEKILTHLIHHTYHDFDTQASQIFRLTNMCRKVNITSKMLVDVMQLTDMPFLNDNLIEDIKAVYPHMMTNADIIKEIKRRNDYQMELNNEVSRGNIGGFAKNGMITI